MINCCEEDRKGIEREPKGNLKISRNRRTRGIENAAEQSEVGAKDGRKDDGQGD